MAGKTIFEEFLEATFALEDPWWGEIVGCLLGGLALLVLLAFFMASPRLFLSLLAGGLFWLIFIRRRAG